MAAVALDDRAPRLSDKSPVAGAAPAQLPERNDFEMALGKLNSAFQSDRIEGVQFLQKRPNLRDDVIITLLTKSHPREVRAGLTEALCSFLPGYDKFIEPRVLLALRSSTKEITEWRQELKSMLISSAQPREHSPEFNERLARIQEIFNKSEKLKSNLPALEKCSSILDLTGVTQGLPSMNQIREAEAHLQLFGTEPELMQFIINEKAGQKSRDKILLSVASQLENQKEITSAVLSSFQRVALTPDFAREIKSLGESLAPLNNASPELQERYLQAVREEAVANLFGGIERAELSRKKDFSGQKLSDDVIGPYFAARAEKDDSALYRASYGTGLAVRAEKLHDAIVKHAGGSTELVEHVTSLITNALGSTNTPKALELVRALDIVSGVLFMAESVKMKIPAKEIDEVLKVALEEPRAQNVLSQRDKAFLIGAKNNR